jgi:outer membrane protein assembly factor BamB
MATAQAVEAPVSARRAFLAAALAAAAIAPPLPARAAGGGFGTWSVEDSEEVRSRLEEANRLLGTGHAAGAAPLLQEILDRFPDHLVRAPDPRGRDPRRYLGARTHVLALLRGLSPDARRAYEAHVLPRAEEALERCLRTRNADALDAAAERYCLAGDAGPRLLLAAADLRLARGEPGRAVAPLRTLLREHAGAPAAGPAVVARLARALSRAGDRDGVLALRRAHEGRAAEAVSAGGTATTLGAVLEECLAAAGPPPRPSDTPMLGGDPTRRGLGVPAEALGPPRWSEDPGRSLWTHKDYEQRLRESSVNESLKAARPVAAAIVDGVLYYHWNSDITARDLYTGAERWRFRVKAVPRADTARTHGALLACPAVAGGLVYAPLMVWPDGEPAPNIVFANQDIIPLIPVRRLFAVDASTGRLAWTHDDPRPAGDPFADRLRMLNVTSSPLVLGDLVVAAGATYDNQFTAWCFAADRRTGKVRWATRLGYGQQELNLFGRTIKEIPVAAVASDGERLFVQTNMGIVTCLDAASGRTVWVHGYKETEIPLYDNFWTTPERRFTWSGSPPVVAGGLVLAAPADAEDLVALAADTGEKRWDWPCRDSRALDSPRMSRLLAADDERAYIAGRSAVRAIDLRTGKLAWEQPFPGPGRTESSAGRGVLADGRLFVPTNRGVHVLDVRNKGAILRTDPLAEDRGADPEECGGNLVTTEGASAILYLDRVEGHYRPEDVKVRANSLLRDRPRDPDALLEAARIYVAADRPDDAMPLLERALEAVEALPDAGREGRLRVVRDAILGVREKKALALCAQGKALEAREAFLATSTLAPDPASATGVLLRGARALRELTPTRLDLAASLVEVVVSKHGDAILDEESHTLENEPGRCTAASYALWNLANWASAESEGARALAAAQRILERPATDLLFGDAARKSGRQLIEDVLAAHGREIYAPYEAKAAAALEAARRDRDAAALAAIAERWPNARAARRASLEEARLRLDEGDAAAVVNAMRRMLAGELEDVDAAAAHWLLGEGLARSGRAAAARAVFLLLASEYRDVPLELGETRVAAGEAVARRLEAADLRVAPAGPRGLPSPGPWRELWIRELPPASGARLLEPAGDPVPGDRVLLLRGATLAAFDAKTGAPLWNASGREFRGAAASAGGFLVFAMDEEAIGVDPSSGETLWRRELPGTAQDVAVVEGAVVVLMSGLPNPDDGLLSALDPTTGDRAWPRDAVLAGGASRLHARDGVVACDGAGTNAALLRLVDGRDGSVRPFQVSLRSGNEAPAEALVPRTGPILLRREDRLDAFESQSGKRTWQFTAPARARLASASVGEGGLAVLDVAGNLMGVDVAKGYAVWTAKSGSGRLFDPSATALLADGRAVYSVTAAVVNGRADGERRLEARALADGKELWSIPLAPGPVLVEIAPAGEALLVKVLAAGPGPDPRVPVRTGVVVVARADGKVLDRFEDDRLGGTGFAASLSAGVLAVANERFLIVRGR